MTPSKVSRLLGVSILFVTTLFALLVPLADSDAQSREAQAFATARANYLRLAKLDPQVSDLARWDRAASDLLIFTREFPNTDYTAKALYLLARLHEFTFRKRELQSGLSQSIYFYSRLATQFPQHSLADDAILFLGDLQKEGRADTSAAEEAYTRIIEYYPRGDMYQKARERLGMQAGESLGAFRSRIAVSADSKQELATNKREEAESRGIFSWILGDSSVGKDGVEVYSKKPARARPVIVIDPGHGGEEDGAIGVDGVKEKDVVLEISLMLEEMLKQRLRADTVLTRREDIHVPLAERTGLANEKNADLFISVHANASVYKTARGVETYYLDNTNDRSSLKLAKRENAAFAAGDIDDLSFILSDLIQNAKLDESITLAHYLQDQLSDTLGKYYKGVKNLGVKKAPFYVLVGAHMPCVLVEVSFLDHPVEGRRLITRRYKQLVATALFDGIRLFFEGEVEKAKEEKNA